MRLARSWLAMCSSSASGSVTTLPIPPIADHPGRDAADERPGGHVAGDHGAHADDRMIADRHTVGDSGSGSDPDVAADHDPARADRLLADGRARIETMIEGIDHDPGG